MWKLAMWQVVGQNHAVRQLKLSLESGRLSHAYLFVGPPHVGKGTLALNLAQAVNCLSELGRPCNECQQCRRIAAGYHADVQVIGPPQPGGNGPPRKEVGIDDVRAIEGKVHLKPYEGAYRVFIFDGAERMSEEAANALLKILEEPPPQSLLILLASQDDQLLPTISSRCRRIELRPLSQADVLRYISTNHSIEEDQAQIMARLSKGCLGWALLALKNPSLLEQRRSELDRIINLEGATVEQRFSTAANLASLFYRDRSEAQDVLDVWLGWWRDLLLVREGAEESVYNLDYLDTLQSQAALYTSSQIADFIGVMLDTLEALDHNVNPRLSLEVLMLAMPGRGMRVPK